MLDDISLRFNDDSVFELGRVYFLKHGAPNNLGEHITRISRVHCRFTRRDDGSIWLEDVSSNGTMVNGQLLAGKGEPRVGRLEDGDKITLLVNEDNAPLLEYVLVKEADAKQEADEVEAEETGNGDKRRRSRHERGVVDSVKEESEPVTKKSKMETASAWTDAAQVGVFAVGWYFLWNLVPKFV